ncbi:MAG: NUDIX domain-containing protein [Planctomycetota bacterium]
MRFCCECGGALEQRVPDGDDRTRHVCRACGRVHYRNPQVVVGCLVERGDHVLLCRRAIEPGRGRWTIPAGYLELGEGMLQGARRETREEAGAAVEIVAPHCYLDLPHIGQTHAVFRARATTAPHAGHESLEVAFFAWGALPWTELAFPAVHFALHLRQQDRAAVTPHLHTAQLQWDGNGSRFDAANYRLVEHLRQPLA